MLCKNPYPRGVHLFPCGQCMPCRFNRRRTWAHRIMLEAALYSDNAFVTLTYAEENLKFRNWDGSMMTASEVGSSVDGMPLAPSLIPMDLTLWLKRLRAAWADRTRRTLRYYAVGEYGDQTQRPHYHIGLFNFPSCMYGGTRVTRSGKCCEICDLVRDTWSLGKIHIGTLTIDSSQYLAGYVTKKMTKEDDSRLHGRYPEFARMSRRPGIGAGFMHEVASGLLSQNIDAMVDVPFALRHGGRSLPLGRYLRNKLRELVGREAKTPQAVLDAMAEELRELYEASGDDEKGHDPEAFKSAALAKFRQKVLQFETKSKIFNRGKERL